MTQPPDDLPTTPAPGPPGSTTVTKQDTPAKVLAIFIGAMTGGYFIPGSVATFRGTDNQALIWWLCALTSWTVIGWVVALILAAQRTGRRVSSHPDWPSRHPVLLSGAVVVALGWLIIVGGAL